MMPLISLILNSVIGGDKVVPSCINVNSATAVANQRKPVGGIRPASCWVAVIKDYFVTEQ